jgi:hypothetical protein
MVLKLLSPSGRFEYKIFFATTGIALKVSKSVFMQSGRLSLRGVPIKDRDKFHDEAIYLSV